jgi:hypothetical protein
MSFCREAVQARGLFRGLFLLLRYTTCFQVVAEFINTRLLLSILFYYSRLQIEFYRDT